MDPDAKTRAEETKPDPHIGRTFDGFRIESVIGQGGMGVVYKATQLSLNRPVAIKVIPEHVAEHPQFLERFHREVDVLSRLNHPNIVTVIDRGDLDGHPYLVMEFVEGTALREVIKKGPLPSSEALVVVRGVLSALEHAHDRGIIHRDIKPENVLVAPGGIVKVADFGLGRLLGPQEMTRLTHTHLMLGTFEYMAPEQREKAKEADERADLYATGVVLYETIAGELPIGNFDSLSDSRIDKVVRKSLEKSPEKRFQRASEMGDAVSQLLTPMPVEPELKLEPASESEAPAREPERPAHRKRNWRVGIFATAIWVFAAWTLADGRWRDETGFFFTLLATISVITIARMASKPRPTQDDWNLGIVVTALWVAGVVFAADKPWRNENITWVCVGAVASVLLIPRLRDIGRAFISMIVAVGVLFAVLFLFWGVSSHTPMDDAATAPLSGPMQEVVEIPQLTYERDPGAEAIVRWVREVVPIRGQQSIQFSLYEGRKDRITAVMVFGASVSRLAQTRAAAALAAGLKAYYGAEVKTLVGEPDEWLAARIAENPPPRIGDNKDR